MLGILIVCIGLCLTLFLVFSRKLSNSHSWQATVTPLASIMGSGFLVSAPLLAGVVGNFAVLCMSLLLLLAFSIGSVMRFNIEHFEPIENEKGIAQDLALLSRIVLAGAYFISITYYLQLLAVFLLKILSVDDILLSNWIASALISVIGMVGIWKGLTSLEKIEKYAISLNLGMIGALLFALIWHNIGLWSSGNWQLPSIDSSIDLTDLRVLLGLLIVVQGFETSRFLGSKYDPDLRIRSMKNAQLLSSAIYVVFISLATVLFHRDLGSDVTAVIDLVAPIALILPILVTIAATVSQFSAAVADTAGAGGLVQEVTHEKLPLKYIYLLILIIAIFLTWETDVNQIIAYASRAFALFYTLQCAVGFLVAKQSTQMEHRNTRLLFFALLTMICLSVFVFGIPSE